MGLTDKIQRIKKSWDKVNGEGSELLIITLLITTIWILLTHTV